MLMLLTENDEPLLLEGDASLLLEPLPNGSLTVALDALLVSGVVDARPFLDLFPEPAHVRAAESELHLINSTSEARVAVSAAEPRTLNTSTEGRVIAPTL